MSFQKRAADLRAVAIEHLPGEVSEIEAEIVTLICNGCGLTVSGTVELLQSYATDHDWQLATELGGDDFCGRCHTSG